MAEYLIQEETLNSIADILREKFENHDTVCCLLSEKGSLTDIIIPDDITEISDFIFCDCENLTNITIPDSVARIGEGAFRHCKKLQNIEIPDTVTSMSSSYTFAGCTNLISVTLSKNVTSLGDLCFEDCIGMTDFYLRAETPPSIHSTAFRNTTCTFHVPVNSENTYKSATNWSEYADRIIGDVII